MNMYQNIYTAPTSVASSVVEMEDGRFNDVIDSK